jgi:raffinose/stachyose/melibiose transport system permease protein
MTAAADRLAPFTNTVPSTGQARPRLARSQGLRRRRWPTTPAAAIARRAPSLLLALAWLLFAAGPIYYMFIVSLEPQSSYLSSNPWFPTTGLTISNYSTVFGSGFGQYLLNSLVTTLGTTVLAVAVSLLAANVIVRRAKGIPAVLFRTFLIGLAVPIQALIIPLYVEILRLHFYNTLLALIIPLAAFSIPLTVLILVNFLRDIPRELVDAIQIDGAGPVRQLTALVIPVARPAITTVAIYDALTAWNNFLFPLIFTQSSNVAVLPLAIFNFSSNHLIDIPAIMAAVFLSVAPLFVLYIGARRQIIGGLTAGFSR